MAPGGQCGPRWCWLLYSLVVALLTVRWMGPDLLFSARDEPARPALPAPSSEALAAPAAAGPSAEAPAAAGAAPPSGPRLGDGVGRCTQGAANAACPGSIEPPMRAGTWSFGNYMQAWRNDLGDRVLQIQGEATEQQCSGFFVWGDYAWCNRAVEPTAAARRPSGGVVGISFGIRDRDPWSELMSNRYGVRTELYDCFYGVAPCPVPQKNAPCGGVMGYGMTGGELRAGALGLERCPLRDTKSGPKQGCFDAPYRIHRVCVSNTSCVDKKTGHAWPYTTLRAVLHGFEPLSVHLKIDVEGSEWNQLDALLGSPEDLAKIRTLDMEIHYGLEDWNSPGRCHEEEYIAWKVGLIERLAKYFVVSGTTLQAVIEKQSRLARRGTEQLAGELNPNGRHCMTTSTGWDLGMYCLSFVSRELLAAP
ncbi:unnamed protein product [Prorocentrum cordatum]|uniref:Methyltransferase domain-containing protein n=1 Tax=Prorocentrum cordatum TaxID=2364126 RepID=A0ABN9TPT7_9DINO|nr:unnamed protein product [Polarella glacialis]